MLTFNLTELSSQAIQHKNINLFDTVVQVKVLGGVQFSFSDHAAYLVLEENLEKLNFTEITTITVIGQVKNE